MFIAYHYNNENTLENKHRNFPFLIFWLVGHINYINLRKDR